MKRSDGLPGGTSRYAHALTFTVLGQLVLGATRLIVLACLGRVEGRAVLGETVALLALGTFLVLLGPQAIGAAASRYISMASSSFDTHRQASVEALTSKTSLISFLPLGLVAVSAARVALGAGWIESLWAGVLPACLGAASYARAVRYGRLRFAQGFVWDCLGAASTLAAMAAVLIADAPAHALLPLCLGYLVSAVAGWPRSRFAVPLQSADAKEVLRYAAWTAVQVVAAGGLLQAVTWLAALRTGPLELGALGAAVSIATPMLLLSIALRTSLTPFLARDVSTGDLQPLNDSIDLLQRGMSAIFIPTFGIACIWAPVLLRLIFGEQYADASDLLVILLLAVSVNCLNASHVWLGVALASGPKLLAICNAAGLGIGVVLALHGPTESASLWAALGYLAGSSVSAVSAALVVWSRTRMAWGGVFVRIIAGYALLAGCLAASNGETGLNVALSVIFLMAWVLMSWTDHRQLRGLLPTR